MKNIQKKPAKKGVKNIQLGQKLNKRSSKAVGSGLPPHLGVGGLR